MGGLAVDYEVEERRQRRERAVALVARGGDVLTVAREFGIKPDTLRKQCQRKGVYETHPNPTYACVVRSDGRRYANCEEAARDLGIHRSQVSAVARGRARTVHGYGFFYERGQE